MNTILEQINSAGYVFVEFALPMLVQASVLIVVLLLADLLLRKKVRAVFRYWLWMLVLLKLVLPTTLSSPVSLGSWFGDELTRIKVSESAFVEDSKGRYEIGLPARSELSTRLDASGTEMRSAEGPRLFAEVDVDQPLMKGGTTLAEPPTPLTWKGIVFLVWAAVVAAMGLLLLQRAIFVSGLVAQAKNPTELMNGAFRFCCGQMGLKGKVGLKVSANTASPAVCGLFRPVILLPQNLAPALGSSHLRTVLLHELAHIRRGDLWVNLVQTVLQIIYFYNPLLWLANSVIRRIREQAVDEAVQVAMGANAPQYPQTLLDVAKMVFNRPALSLRLIGVVESKSALKGRIKRMLNRPIPKTAKLGILGLITLIIVGCMLLPMAKAKEQETRTEYSFITVTEGLGFDDFIVGDANCTGQFIKSKLGKPDEENKDEKQGWWLNYREKYGLDFWLNLQENTLYEIRLNEGFEGKLSSGISMSSTKQDVFKVYGEPLREEVVEDLTKRFDDRVLLIRKGGFAKIHYDDKGLLFWFDGDKLTQIRVGVVSVPGSNKGRGDANSIKAKPGKENKTEKQGWWKGFVPDIFIMGPGSEFKEIVALTQGWTGNKTSRLHQKEHYDEIFVGPYEYKAETGDLIVLVFSLDTEGRIPSEYADLLPRPWTEIEDKLNQGDTVELLGKARGLNVIVLAAPKMEQIKEVIAESKYLHNPKQFVGSIGRGSDPGIEDFNIEYDPDMGVYSVTVSIRNHGEVASPKFIVNFYRGDPNQVKPMTHGAGPIEPCGVWNERSRPFGLNEGINEISVVLDPANLVEESNETNNNALMEIVIKDGRLIEKSVSYSPHQQTEIPGLKTDVQLETHGVNEVINKDKMVSENLAAQGWALWQQRKLAEAEKAFGKAVLKDPTNANAWNGLGWAQQNQGKPLNAKASFEKCLQIQPKHAAALNGLGWIAKAQGRTDEAIAHWEKAIEAAPDATAALNGLATTYMELKQFDKAVKYYKMWLKVEPDNADAKAGLEKAKSQKTNVQLEAEGTGGKELEKTVEQAVMTISTCAETDPRVKQSLESLQGLDEQAVVKELVKFLDSDKDTVRRSAIYILWKGDIESIEQAVPGLQKLCSHKEYFTRGMAALALGARKVEPSFDTLCNMTLNDSSAYARRCAAYALGLMGNPEAKDVLEKALKDSDFNVRNNAEAALTMLSQVEKPKSEKTNVQVDVKGSGENRSRRRSKNLELSNDDGSSAGKRSIAGSGHAVRFEAPSDECTLKAVRIYGSRYGEVQAPKEDFHIWLCDNNFKVIEDFPFPYNKFKRGNPTWVLLSVKPTKLPKQFIICAGFDPHQTKGVYVHYDAQSSGNSFVALPGGEMTPFKDGDWMIRAVLADSAGDESLDAASHSARSGETVIVPEGPSKSATQTKPPAEQNQLNEAVYKQLDEIVDLSKLSPEMPFAQAIEQLKYSVAPPLKVVVLWRDLSDNTGISQTTPINMDAIPAVRLGTALKLLLKSVSGNAVLDYAVEDGMIFIATIDSLPTRFETSVYDISDLVGSAADADDIARLVINTVEPDSWENKGGRGTLTTYNDKKLIVYQTREIHKQIRDLLQGLQVSSNDQGESKTEMQ
jgi:beta-lactamase regulating signal transducer with metallopeptidase domain/tetratricopeptide (TPR) repeat protein